MTEEPTITDNEFNDQMDELEAPEIESEDFEDDGDYVENPLDDIDDG